MLTPTRGRPERTNARAFEAETTPTKGQPTMEATVHHPEPESIGETAAAVSEKPDTRHWSDVMWADSPLALGVANRLARIDRALQGMRAINDLLRMTQASKQTALDHGEDIPDTLLALWHVDSLHAALMELQDSADGCIEDLRDNHLGCCGKSPARKAA